MGRKRTESDLPPNVYKRGKVYYVRVWADGRSVWRKAGSTLRAAQMVLAKVRQDVEREELGLPKKRQTTVAEWAPKFKAWTKAHKRSWERDERSLKQLLPVFGPLRLREVTKARVDAYQLDRLEDVSGPTVNREIACLRKLLSHAVEAGELETNQLLGVRMLPESPARQPTLSAEEEGKLLDASPDWLRLLVRLAIGTGARQGELLALQWKHIDFGQKVVVIADSKSGESRRVPLHPDLARELRGSKGAADALVVTRDGEAPDRHALSKAFKRVATKLGREDLRFHDLRHVCATRLLAAGASAFEIMAVLGHTAVQTTRRYSHVTWGRLHGLVANVPLAGTAPQEQREEHEDGQHS